MFSVSASGRGPWAVAQRQVRASSFNPNEPGRIIMPGQQQGNRTQPGRILMPGQMQQPTNPNSQPESGNFASIGQDVAGSVPAPPRNFRPPTGAALMPPAPHPDTTSDMMLLCCEPGSVRVLDADERRFMAQVHFVAICVHIHG